LEATVDLQKRNRTISLGVVLAVALAAGLREAPAQQNTKKATQSTTSKPAAKSTQPVKPPVTSHCSDCGPGGGGPKPRVKPPVNPPGRTTDPIKYQPRATDQVKSLPGGGKEYQDANTKRTVRVDEHGQVKRVEAPGLLGNKTVITRGPGGTRMVETGRLGARVVSYGPNRGFVERTVRPHVISRTYIVGDRRYVRGYHEYEYHGVHYYRYVPAVYYGPAFYGWVSTPWAPVPYVWGNGITAPWLGFYGAYFVPAPVYASPALWLTDYLLAENLRVAYQNQQSANGGQASTPPAQQSDPTQQAAMKALIAEEVRQQLAAERAAAAAQPTSSNSQDPAPGTEQPPPALNQKFFVVSSNLDVTAAAQTCALTPGDIIQRTGKEVTSDGSIAVEVESSKPCDCPRDSATAVQLMDLQEMHNQFREQIDTGLSMLAENKAPGLQTGPAATPRPVADGTADQPADAAAQLEATQKAADNLEAQVSQVGN
jgi:hypothetical protein